MPAVAQTYREKLLLLIGNEHSGNYGHAGRPGQVGGSAKLAEKIAKVKLNPKHDAPTSFGFDSQVEQFPATGKPGIGVQREAVAPGKFVDIVTHRDDDGKLRGIAYHYPQDIPPYEKKGNVNIMVDPKAQRQGIATRLLEEADSRWDIDLKKQAFTKAGRQLIEGLQAKAKSPAELAKFREKQRQEAEEQQRENAAWEQDFLRKTPKTAFDRFEEQRAAALKAEKQKAKPKRKTKKLTHDQMVALLLYGTSESGNYGHAGRPGQVGGSAPSGNKLADVVKAAGTVAVLQGVDAQANAEASIAAHLARHEDMTGVRPDAETLKATETELRALPLVHGTSVSGALGAFEGGIFSNDSMPIYKLKSAESALDKEIDEIVKAAGGEPGLRLKGLWMKGQDEGYAQRDAGEIADLLGMDRRDAEDLLAKHHELEELRWAIEGATYPADSSLDLDKFVFMTHGAKHQDYGRVGIVIDNALVNKGFATEQDIIRVADPDKEWSKSHSDYSPDKVKNYQKQIVAGDDYYRVAAAAAGSPEMLPSRSREQLFEVKVPKQVPKEAIKGFITDDYDDARRLSERLARKGFKGKVLYVDRMSKGASEFLHRQMKAIQETGEWDEDAVQAYDDATGNSGSVALFSGRD